MTTDPAMQGAIMFYAADCYPIFDHIGLEAAKAAVAACTEWSNQIPLHMRDATGEFPKLYIPHFQERSSIYAMALMSAFLVWTQRDYPRDHLPNSLLLQFAADGFILSGRQFGKKKFR